MRVVLRSAHMTILALAMMGLVGGLLAAPAGAQVVGANLSGAVTDDSGVRCPA
jgi:hypothetical protein